MPAQTSAWWVAAVRRKRSSPTEPGLRLPKPLGRLGRRRVSRPCGWARGASLSSAPAGPYEPQQERHRRRKRLQGLERQRVSLRRGRRVGGVGHATPRLAPGAALRGRVQVTELGATGRGQHRPQPEASSCSQVLSAWCSSLVSRSPRVAQEAVEAHLHLGG